MVVKLINVVFHEFPQMADFLVLILIEVVAALATRAKLRQVVVKRFLGHTHLLCCIFQAQPLVIEVFVVIAVV